MPYVITEACINTKDKTCVDVCPVDCIYEGPEQLYINPDECIDCGACEPVCPTKAIFPESDLPEKFKEYKALNADFAGKWPQLSEKKAPLPDADKFKDATGKRAMLDPKPGA